MKDQCFSFGKLDTHSAIIMQKAIENRKMNISLPDSEIMKKGEKVLKAVIEELDQMNLDLDRHIAANVRQENYKIEADHFPPELT
jgi:hypothetical protein